MKPILKLLISALAVCLIGAAVFGLVAFASTDDGKNGTFNDSPAHIDENDDLIVDDINFPDKNFRDYVLGFDKDSNGSLSEEEVAEVYSIDVRNSGIESLSGIEFFTELTDLNCANNKIAELNVSKNTLLFSLLCYNNQLSVLNMNGLAHLNSLICYNNKLSEIVLYILPLSFDCSNNELVSIKFAFDITGTLQPVNTSGIMPIGTASVSFNFSNNHLTGLDPSIYSFVNNDSYIWDIELGEQTYTGLAKYEYVNEKYTLNLGAIAGSDAVAHIISVYSKEDETLKGQLDKGTGIVTFDRFPGDIVYSMHYFYRDNGITPFGPDMLVNVGYERFGVNFEYDEGVEAVVTPDGKPIEEADWASKYGEGNLLYSKLVDGFGTAFINFDVKLKEGYKISHIQQIDDISTEDFCVDARPYETKIGKSATKIIISTVKSSESETVKPSQGPLGESELERIFTAIEGADNYALDYLSDYQWAKPFSDRSFRHGEKANSFLTIAAFEYMELAEYKNFYNNRADHAVPLSYLNEKLSELFTKHDLSDILDIDVRSLISNEPIQSADGWHGLTFRFGTLYSSTEKIFYNCDASTFENVLRKNGYVNYIGSQVYAGNDGRAVKIAVQGYYQNGENTDILSVNELVLVYDTESGNWKIDEYYPLDFTVKDGKPVYQSEVTGTPYDPSKDPEQADRDGTFNGLPARVDKNGALKIDDINFPDKNFRDYVSGFDTNKDGSLSEEEVAKVEIINVDESDIRSLSGIGYFTELGALSCSKNEITELDLRSNKKLYSLDCSHNLLTKLLFFIVDDINDYSGNNDFSEINCSYNKLTELVIPGLVRNFNCSHNELVIIRFALSEMLEELWGDTSGIATYGGARHIYDFSDNHLTHLDSSVYKLINMFLDGNSWSVTFGEQTYIGIAMPESKDGKYTLDIGAIAGDDAVEYILSVYSKEDETLKGALDKETGIVTFDRFPGDIVYSMHYIYWSAPAGEPFGPDMLVDVRVGTELADEKADVSAVYPSDEAEYYYGAVFHAELLTEGKLYDLAKGALGKEYEKFVPYSLTLTDKDGKPLSLKSKVTVSVPVPEGWDAKDTLVFFVDENGKPQAVTATASEDGKYILFETDHFSVWTLTNASTKIDTPTTDDSKDTTTPGTTTPGTGDVEPPKTSTPMTVAVWFAVMLLTVVCGTTVYASIKRRRSAK